MTADEIVELIEALKQERDALVQEANRQLAYLDGKIAMLGELLARQNGHAPEEAAQTIEV